MNKLKNYSIIILVSFLLISVGAWKLYEQKYKDEKADKERWIDNFNQVSDENNHNKQIILSEREFKKTLSDSLKDVLRQLKIKPKTVEKIVERSFTDKITGIKVVPVSFVAKNTWQINDSVGCLIYRATAYLKGDSLKVVRTYASYQNNSIDVLHRRERGKFIFWKTYYRNKFNLTTKTKCGEESSKTIEVQK
jgi:hypothetical protein